MKELIIHSGPPKTGTTTIQAFLSSAQNDLLEDGVLYPDSGRLISGNVYKVLRGGKKFKTIKGPSTAHHLLPWTLDRQVFNPTIEKCWSSVVEEIDSINPKTIIISSEDFAWLSEKKLYRLRGILSKYLIKIWLYYRNPLKWMLSRYNQIVKVGKYQYSFGTFINEGMPYSYLDYDKLIARHINCFGKENVLIKNFDAIVDKVGLEREIINSLGLKYRKYEKYFRKSHANISLTDERVRMIRYLNFFENSIGKYIGLRRICSNARQSIIRKGKVYRLLHANLPKIVKKPVCCEEDIRILEKRTKKWSDNIPFENCTL